MQSNSKIVITEINNKTKGISSNLKKTLAVFVEDSIRISMMNLLIFITGKNAQCYLNVGSADKSLKYPLLMITYWKNAKGVKITSCVLSVKVYGE